jgi:hypothetical protein
MNESRTSDSASNSSPTRAYLIQECIKSAKNLDQLADHIATMRSYVSSGEISLIDQQLGPIFDSLRQLLTEDDLSKGLEILQNSTLFLTEKLDEINRFISQLSQREKYLRFLQQNPSDERLAGILSSVWNQPMRLFPFSIQFLHQSYTQLVQNKPIRRFFHSGEVLESPSVKPTMKIDDKAAEFEIEMNMFYDELHSKLPLNLTEILSPYTEPEAYYTHFSYLLHLLYLGKLFFDRTTNRFIDSSQVKK